MCARLRSQDVQKVRKANLFVVSCPGKVFIARGSGADENRSCCVGCEPMDFLHHAKLLEVLDGGRVDTAVCTGQLSQIISQGVAQLMVKLVTCEHRHGSACFATCKAGGKEPFTHSSLRMFSNVIREILENLKLEIVGDLGPFTHGGAHELKPLGMILFLHFPKRRRDAAPFAA